MTRPSKPNTPEANTIHTDGRPFRVAIYARYSSELQNELSLEDQIARCREEIARRGWRVAGVYTDSARSGWSLDREGFQMMKAAAEKGRFDGVMFWKFDRLARDHNHTVMIKALLRHHYDLKLFCVEGVSSDDDNSPYTTLVEQMIAVFSSFYSQNLSSDTKRAKRARAVRGEYNGSKAPMGYIFVTSKKATPERPAGLYIDPEVAPVMLQAFRRYATGKYSDNDIAEWLNAQPEMVEICRKRRPISKDVARDFLQNRLYTGRVAYAETIYDGSTLGKKRKSRRKRIEWFEGKHEAIVPDDLFERCQQVRASLRSTRKKKGKRRVYVLPNRVFCAHCIARDHEHIENPYYGRMRISWHKREKVGHYRCISRDRGFGECVQGYVAEDVVLEQLVTLLTEMEIPPKTRQRIEDTVQAREANEDALDRIAELEAQKARIQFSWEHGQLSPEEYLKKQSQVEREIASLRPLDYDKLEDAADLITHFRSYWDQCAEVDEPREARKQLMAQIVDRVFLYDDTVIAVALHPDFGIILDVPDAAPDDIMAAVRGKEKGHNPSSELYPVRRRRGSTQQWARPFARYLGAA